MVLPRLKMVLGAHLGRRFTSIDKEKHVQAEIGNFSALRHNALRLHAAGHARGDSQRRLTDTNLCPDRLISCQQQVYWPLDVLNARAA